MATQKGLNSIKKWESVKLQPYKQICQHVNDDVDVIYIIRGCWKAYLPPRVGSSVNFSNPGNRTITVDIMTIDRFENDSLQPILEAMGFRVIYANFYS